MKKDLRMLNRTLALAITAAMTVTSTPGAVFAADAFSDGGAVVAEAPADQSPELISDGSTEPVEEVFVDGDAEEVSVGVADAELDPNGIPEKPAAVTNLAIDEDGTLSWDATNVADRYELSVEDAGKGYTIIDDSWDGTEYQYSYPSRFSNSTDVESIYGVAMQFNAATNTWERPKDSNGSSIYLYGLQPGTAYTIKVRAVNTLNGKETAGDWSNAVTYTKAAVTALDKVSNIQVDKDGRLTFNYDGAADFEMSVRDQLNREYYSSAPRINEKGEKEFSYGWVYDGMSLNDRSLKTYEQKDGQNYYTPVQVDDPANPGQKKDVTAFEEGNIYTIQVRAYSYNTADDKKLAGEWSDAVTYAPVKEVAEKPVQTSIRQNGDTLRWNQVENAIGYEVCVKDETGNEYKEDDAYYNNGNSTSVDVSELTYYTSWKDASGNIVKPFAPDKKYTVSVRAYNNNEKNEKQYADWSDPVEVVVASKAAPAKVAGVYVNESGRIFWEGAEKVEAYEIEVKDSKGREYHEGLTTDNTRIYATTYGTSYSPSGLYTYSKVDGQYTPVLDPKTGEEVTSLSVNGETYTLRVRAYNYNDKGEKQFGEWSKEVTYTKPMPSTGVNAKPATVTGVNVKIAEEDAGEWIGEAQLRWNYVDKADRYEFLVKDAAGNEYSYGYDSDKAQKGELERIYEKVDNYAGNYYPVYYISDLSGMKAYVKNPGVAIDTVKDAKGKDLETFVPGQTYTIQVRAVNVYTEWDPATGHYKKPVETVGDWSAPAPYTAGSIAAITDLKYVSEDEDNYYFTYSAVINNGSVYYQIATDNTFSTASLVNGDWKYANTSVNKLAISKDSEFEAGRKYFVRAINSIDMPEKDEVAALNPVPAEFTATAPAPKNITGLEMYMFSRDDDEYGEGYSKWYNFRFDAVLEKNDSFELQYTYNAQPTEEDWIRKDGETRLSIDELNEGTVYVRAVAYVKQYDNKTGEKIKVYGQPSNVLPVNVSKTVSTINGLKLAEKTQNSFKFNYVGTPQKNEDVEFWYSETPDFASDSKLTMYGYGSETGSFEIPYSKLTTGKAYYVRARIVNDDAKDPEKKYSAYSNVVKVTAVLPRISVTTAEITSSTILLKMDRANDDKMLTGYEIQRKDGKKYVAVAKITDNQFKNKKLKKDTTYRYRVRPYYYNPKSGKTANGNWTYCEATTWGGALKLTARAAGKTSVKLSWKKISGAQGYEVYRKVSSSANTTVSDGLYNGYSKYVLVKTLSAKTSRYTDKGVNCELDYEYMVRAYKNVGKKKYYISDSAVAPMSFASFGMKGTYKEVKYSSGKVRVTWSPVYTASGYLVEKYDADADKWTAIKRLKTKSYAYTLPATKGNETVGYRIRAYKTYKGTEYSNPIEVRVAPYLAASAKVVAKANASDGSIKVTWRPVKGAEYYEVYRTTFSQARYDSTAKAYTYTDYYDDEYKLPRYVEDSTKVAGYRVAKLEDKKATSFVDRKITYTVNGVTNTLTEGPREGVKYFYYVRAYRKGAPCNYVDSMEDNLIPGVASKAAYATVTKVKNVKTSLTYAKNTGKKKVVLKWKKVADAVGYEVYRSTSKTKGFTKIATIKKGKTTSFADKKAAKGKTYYYKVRVIKRNEAGIQVFSSYSKVKGVKVKK